MKLSKMALNKPCVIIKLNFNDKKQREFGEIGLTEGVSVEIVRKAGFNGPYELFLRGFYVAIRKNDAENIEVNYGK